MKVAVMGAGAVGCYYGAMLARAGHEVVLIGRPAHVEAVRARGLRLEAQSFDEHVPLAASTEADAVRGADLVLFCVKSTDTEAAAAQIAPHLASGALVLTLQNGVDNDERARSVLRSHEVAAAVVYVATGMAGPGHVKHNGRGELVIAPSARGEEVAQALRAAGVPTEISDNVRGALWPSWCSTAPTTRCRRSRSCPTACWCATRACRACCATWWPNASRSRGPRA